MRHSGFGKSGRESKSSRREVIIVATGVILASLSIVGLLAWQQTGKGIMSKNSHRSTGVDVSGKAGIGKWPLRTIGAGTILCQWHEFAPGSRNPITRRPLILFEAPNGQLYAINGAAESAATKGYVNAASLKGIKVDQRLIPEVGKVLDGWLDAGLALCSGDRAEAQRLVDEANRLASEPMSPGVDFELSSTGDEARRRRIFFELVQCEDQAWRTAGDDFENMKKLEKACYVKMQEKEGLTKEELSAISSEGVRRLWPMP